MTKAEKEIKELREFVDKLAPFEKHFSNAERNFLIMRPQTLGELLTARYGSDWRSKVNKQVTTCSSCKLNEVKKIGLEYKSAKTNLAALEESIKKTKEKENDKDE